MKTREEIQAAINEIGLTSAQAQDNKFLAGVFSLFEDGEISWEKGGDLLYHRTLHCWESGNEDARKWKLNWLNTTRGYGFIHVASENKAKMYAIREALLNNIPS
jgi:hypothetical protein